MTLYEELVNGLQSGIDAYNSGVSLKTTVLEYKDDIDTSLREKETYLNIKEVELKEN